VADERHQAYIRDFASKLIGERVVVQHDWAVQDLAGVHHVTLPVANVARSRDWYGRAFGLVVLHEATGGEGEATLAHPSGSIKVVLREDTRRAEALAGFNVIAFTVATAGDLDAFVARLDTHGVDHGAPVASSTGVTVDVVDPDGLVVQLTTLVP
jgi:catechol 2,3-dioxygenase-like lactoylglutathione lyase family enzyme